jgi:undecaprenyl diphosphate synthase
MEIKTEKSKIPHHVGIIMDGNRRWAQERNLPKIEGHRKGYEKVKLVPGWFFENGVKVVSIFAFSTDNWNREQSEVNYLMKLLSRALRDEIEDLNGRGYRVLLSGRIDELPGDLPEICLEAVRLTKDNKKGTLNICLNYGGRAEIIDAIKKIVKNNVEVEQIHEGMVKKYLYNAGIGDPDIIVRTSGEERLSGFLLWESAYSELYFLKKYWPDFERDDVLKIITEYGERNRRFGE